MSHIQITAFIVTLLIGLAIELYFGRKMVHALRRDMGEYFFSTWAGGAMSAYLCMLASVPGVLILVAFKWLLDVKYSEGFFLLIAYAFTGTAFLAIFRNGKRSVEEEDSRV